MAAVGCTGSFAHVLCNPSYRTRASGRSSMSMEKVIVWHELTCELQDVVRAADHLLVPRGALFMVYPASRFGELTSVRRLHRLEPRTVRCVHPLADRPAKRVLLHAVKAGRADLTVLPPLVLHGDDEHAFTDEVNAMLM
ncbi:hypothetical protein BHS09_20340 [Myxococcus xanthus]|uniref:Methyltransferase n=1 Tax=Myxococcus xanthus TaxID=34 RepID=A0AAE6KTG0_MYXXA|nr:hypothetical protein BHS09_20340 [Myxococcus xanthus]QDE76406.1 hypothetical protein BHS08_20355 [Myxococcus xanthus]QDF05675.1 hypothetical protein BHS04_21075 [Myxococcus xanthus]